MLTAIAKHDHIPIYQGAATPLTRPRLSENAEDIHGASGLDGTDLLPEPRCQARTDVPATDAAAAALRACAPGTAWVVATGSLTNAARLFQTHPELVAHVKGLSLMGGAVGGGHTNAVYGIVDGVARVGNWTPWAELWVVLSFFFPLSSFLFPVPLKSVFDLEVAFEGMGSEFVTSHFSSLMPPSMRFLVKLGGLLQLWQRTSLGC